MRKSFKFRHVLITGFILLLQMGITPIMAVNINNSIQITKKDKAITVIIASDTIPVEDPYGLKMEPLKRPKRVSSRSGYSSQPNSYSQNYWEKGLDNYYDNEEESKPKVIKEPLIEVYNENAKVKKIEDEYSGFKVEIANSPTPLPETDPIFSQHGNIAQQKRSDESFSYYLGHFENEVDAYEFFNKILKERYPLAKVAKFEAGRRIW